MINKKNDNHVPLQEHVTVIDLSYLEQLVNSLQEISDDELKDFVSKNNDLVPLTVMCSQCM